MITSGLSVLLRDDLFDVLNDLLATLVCNELLDGLVTLSVDLLLPERGVELELGSSDLVHRQLYAGFR